MEVFAPIPPAPAHARPLARRPASLRGLRVGILDNSKPNADALLGRVAELLVERASAASVHVWRKPAASRPAEVLDDVAAGADVLLTGSAD